MASLIRAWRVPATRPDPNLFLLPEPDPNYFSKSPSFGFFSASCFPAGRFKYFNNNPQILLFSSRPDTKSSVSKLKCHRYKKWIQGKSGKFDNWFMMHFDLFQSRQSNPKFIKTRSDLDEAAGIGKTTLTILDRRGNWASWCLHHSNWSTEDSSSGSSWKDLHSLWN